MADLGRTAKPRAVLRAAAEGESLTVGAEKLRYVFSSQETKGGFDLIERWVSPHFQSPPLPHTHTREDWMAHVLEGRLGFQVDGEQVELTPGASLLIPRGVYFRWWNPQAAPARLLCFYSPGGFGEFFREVFEDSAKKAARVHEYGKTLTGIMRLHDKYGIIRKEPS